MKSARQGPGATGRRLTGLLLAYLLAVVLAVVLAPFEFEWPRQPQWWLLGPGGLGASDALLNVVLFVPLGFLADRLGGGGWPPWRIALLGLVASLSIEVVQLLIPGRFSTIADIGANAMGAWLGGLGSVAVRRALDRDARLAGAFFLELPLVGYLWLMVPVLWLDALAAGDRLAVIAAAAAGGVAVAAAGMSSGRPMAALRGAKGGGRSGTPRPSLFASSLPAMGWAAMALGPLAVVDWPVALLAVLTTVATAMVASVRFAALRRRERRIEPRAVVAVLVLMLPFLMATTLPGLVPGLGPDPTAARMGILRWLAGVAAFTVIGFLLAEWRGRSRRRWPETAVVPMLLAALVTALADPGAGIAGRLPPAIVAAGLGALLFELQRDHVVFLRRQRDRAHATAITEVTNLAPEG